MKKLIHIDDRRSCLVCDNPQCDYEAPAGRFVWGRHLIGTPCPECGENLLTERDYRDSERLHRFIRWVNRWFGWLGSETPPEGSKVADYSVRHHNGAVEIRMTSIEEQPETGNNP